VSARANERAERGLWRRIEQLDTEPLSGWMRAPDGTSDAERVSAGRLRHFVSEMRRWPDAFVELAPESEMIQLGDPHAILTPPAADAIASHSRLLADIDRTNPSLTTGPMQTGRQHWTSFGRSPHTGEAPNEQYFIVPEADQPAAVKPFRCGLYTSTASAGGLSMWRAQLQSGGPSGYPFHTWELDVSEPVAIAEITSAIRWADLVCAHPRIVKGFLYPDWVSIALSFDAVHITLSTIVAAEGLALTTELGTIPPAFWDVETTFWVRWCFSGARLVEIVRGTA
jgi:hypothetical protein